MPMRPRRSGGGNRPRSWYARTLRTVELPARASSSIENSTFALDFTGPGVAEGRGVRFMSAMIEPVVDFAVAAPEAALRRARRRECGLVILNKRPRTQPCAKAAPALRVVA